MSLKRRLREHYFHFVVVPLSVVGAAFWQAYGRIALFFSVRGIKLPGAGVVKQQMSAEMLAAYERKALIKDIKGQRYTLRHGPLWARSFADKLLRFVSRNRFWFLVLSKSLIAVVLVVLPLGLFLLLRGWLPVPERVPVREAKVHLKSRTQLRTDWLYTEAPFELEAARPTSQFQYLTTEFARGVRVTSVLEPGSPPGLFHFGIGNYPGRVELLRGFLASENAPLILPRQRNVHIDIEGRNRLRARFFLFPQPQGRGFCRLEVRDSSGKLLMSSEAQTPPRAPVDDRMSLSVQFKNRFTPAATGEAGVQEFILDTDNPPDELHVSVSVLGNSSIPALPANANSPRLGLTPASELPPFIKPATSAAQGRDLKDENCIYALGDFGFEWEQVRPLARRGVVFVSVEGLRASTAYDAKLMPNLTAFAKNQALVLRQHRTQANRSFESLASLFTSRYPREFSSVAFVESSDDAARANFLSLKWPTLPALLREQGYRAAALGGVSEMTETMPGGVDFGFHDAVVSEAPQYETRHITEEALAWLERYGDSPFFLFLNYRTLKEPYRPPLENLNVRKSLSHPFGVRHEQELFNGSARYFDSEFALLLDKLVQLGISDDVDIVLTGSHGAQIDAKPFGYFPGVPSMLRGATRSDGHTLLDEEVHVPLILHLAGYPQLSGVEIRQPTAHVDLFPTFAELVSHAPETPRVPPVQRGMSLFKPLQDLTVSRLEALLSTRQSIVSEAAHQSAILLFGGDFSAAPMKYIRQYHPEESDIDLETWPYRTHQRWFSPEQFTSVDFKFDTETVLPDVPSFILRKMRERHVQLAAGERQLKLEFKYSGPANISLQFANSELLPAVVEEHPNTLSLFKRDTGATQWVELSGVVSQNDVVLVNLRGSEFVGMKMGDGARLVGCPAAYEFEPQAFVSAAQARQLCLYSAPIESFVKANYSESQKPVVAQFLLRNEPPYVPDSSHLVPVFKAVLKERVYAQ